MHIFREIVWSNAEPTDKNVLWLHKGLIKYYGSQGWQSINYFTRGESLIQGTINETTISLSRILDVDTYTLRYEDENGVPLTDWDKICTTTNYEDYNDFIKYNVAPYAAYTIGVYNSSGFRVGHINIATLKPNYSKRLFRFGMLADVHNSSDESAEATADLQRALKFFNDKESVSFTCIAGDLTNSASQDAFEIYQTNIRESSPSTPVYATTGNHDAQTLLNVDRWKQYTNCDPTYEVTHTIDGINHHFLFLGMYYWSLGANGKPYKDEDIQWLHNKLEEYKNDKCFVITHLFFPNRAGNYKNIYRNSNQLQGEQFNQLENLVKTYTNTIWFSGHSHWKWYLQKDEDVANIYKNEVEGSYCIHLPSCASPTDSNGTNQVYKPLESEGAIIDVYEDCIVVRGMDLKNLKYLPIAQYKLPMSTSKSQCIPCN